MTSAQLVNLEGKKVGEVSLNDSVFGLEPNTAVLFEALQRQLSNARAGTASAKTRAEVAGGGRKPWRQKGTGRARAGSIRSPLWSGGGVTFGPKPRDYSTAMPKKVRQLALKSALAARAEMLVVVKDFASLSAAKTKTMATVFSSLGLTGKKVLLVLDFACDTCQLVSRAARNIERVKVINLNDLNVKDLLECEAVLTTERTLQAIHNRFVKSDAQPEAEKPARQVKSAPADASETKPSKKKAADSKAVAKPAAAPKAKAETKVKKVAVAETKPVKATKSSSAGSKGAPDGAPAKKKSSKE